MRRQLVSFGAYLCPLCGWWAEPGHQCHPADRCHAVPKYCRVCGWWTSGCGH